MADTTINEQAGHTVDELKALIREAEKALANVGAEAGEEVKGLRDRLRTAYEESKYTLSQAAEIARKQAARADELVRSNPYASIGIATATGLLVGYLVARSCSCNSRS